MKRRKFILLSALGAAAVSVPSLYCAGTNAELDKTLSIPEMLSHLADAATVAETGKAYGAKVPGEYDKHTLEQLLTGNAWNTGNVSPSLMRDTLASGIKNDFTNGKTVIVKGWVLSITEARQCALYSLTASSK